MVTPTITKLQDYKEYSSGTVLNKLSNISIVIPSYNSLDKLVKLIKSISQSSQKPYEVIIVDDGSTDNTIESIISSYPWVKLIQLDKNSGPSRARNIGGVLANKEIILFLDSDIVLTPTAIEVVENRHKNNPSIGGLQGKYHWEAANPGPFSSYKALINHYWFKSSSENTVINFLVTYACTIKKSILLEVGGFSEAYKGADVEDYELGYRISTKYDLLHEPKLEVYHHFPGFVKNTRNYIDRGSKWFPLFIKNKGFDTSGGTTKQEAIARLLGGFAFCTLFLPIINQSLVSASIVAHIIYIAYNFRFFKFCVEKKGVKYLFLAPLFHYLSSIVICFTMLFSVFKYFLFKRGI